MFSRIKITCIYSYIDRASSAALIISQQVCSLLISILIIIIFLELPKVEMEQGIHVPFSFTFTVKPPNSEFN